MQKQWMEEVQWEERDMYRLVFDGWTEKILSNGLEP